MQKYAITANNLSLMYNLSRKKEQRLKEYAINLIKKELFFDEFWALYDVSFKVEKGKSLGIIGKNGAGKSTLLKLVSGLMKPTRGEVFTYGSISPLIELGGGFDRDMTALENIIFVGSMHGIDKPKMMSCAQEILDFSELFEFKDVPVRNFSSGMSARLGFAIATAVNSDILIVDEAIEVGDIGFKVKCEKRILEMQNAGTTMLLVSHSPSRISALCEKALWLENGRVKMQGAADEICKLYKNSN